MFINILLVISHVLDLLSKWIESRDKQIFKIYFVLLWTSLETWMMYQIYEEGILLWLQDYEWTILLTAWVFISLFDILVVLEANCLKWGCSMLNITYILHSNTYSISLNAIMVILHFSNPHFPLHMFKNRQF